jgi:hypothetical protein
MKDRVHTDGNSTPQGGGLDYIIPTELRRAETNKQKNYSYKNSFF